ncbi:MAG: flavin reductase [Eggerthellaceae bacterium]|nr:flavin reductase [Eggerthellaceae bacterium]
MAQDAINTKAFRSMSYGLYIISTKQDNKPVGCVVNTFQQVTSKPARVSVAVNKENYTAGAILESGRFEATVLAESASMELIGRFGFKSSADIDKFADTPHELDPAGIPYVTEAAVAHVGAHVIDSIDVGTHYLIVGEVDFAEVLSDESPMTYAYYHQVKGGKTPPKASSYEPKDGEGGTTEPEAPAAAAEEPTGPRYGWRCMICGYVVEMDELPDDFTCPMCGMGRDMFERIEL